MKILGSLLFLLFALPASAAVLSEPDSAFINIDIDDPSAKETYYGKLVNFPHTYQFHVSATTSFSAQVAGVPQINHSTLLMEDSETGEEQSVPHTIQEEFPDLSLILVKSKPRGVSEISRKRAEAGTWTDRHRGGIGFSMQEGELLVADIGPGVYMLEVSTPENLSPYRLEINGGASVTYRELLMVRSVFDGSMFSLLFVWRVYVPLLVLMALWWYWRKKKKQDA